MTLPAAGGPSSSASAHDAGGGRGGPAGERIPSADPTGGGHQQAENPELEQGGRGRAAHMMQGEGVPAGERILSPVPTGGGLQAENPEEQSPFDLEVEGGGGQAAHMHDHFWSACDQMTSRAPSSGEIS